MKNIFAVLLILTATILTGCGSSQITSGQVFIVGIDDEYAPLGFRNENNEIVGFDIDLANEAAKRLGIRFEFKPIDWSNKKQMLNLNEIDLIWNGFDITPEREQYVLFSKPYMENHQVIMVKKDFDSEIRSEGDLAGKRVGTQAGSTSVNYVEGNPQLKDSFAEFKTYLNFKEAIASLMNGEVDVLISDELLSRYIVGHHSDDLKVFDVPIGNACEIGIGFRKDRAELRDEVQRVFDDMIKDGTAKKISEKWFHADLIKFRK